MIKMKRLKLIGFIGLLAIAAIGFQGCTSGDIIEPADIAQQAAPEAPKKEVSPAQAEKIATLFSADRFNINPAVASRSSQTIETITATDGTPLAYVVNTNGAGWAIVSAVRTYYPIIAYSDDPKATFSLSDDAVTQSGLAVWMSEIKEAIATSESIDSIAAYHIALEWLKYEPETTAGPLPPGGNSEQAVACLNRMKYLNDTYAKDGWTFKALSSVTEVSIPQSVYDNASYYGSPTQYTIVGLRDKSTRREKEPLLTTSWHQEPPYNDLCNGYYAGCVTIAVAQILKYHKFPTSYNWDAMPDSWASTETKELIRTVGNAVGIKYDSNNVSSNIDNAKNAFTNTFNYTTTQQDFTTSAVVSELTMNRPVYIRATDKNSGEGHAWVIDGYIENRSLYDYYVEYLNTVGEYDNHGETLLQNPGQIAGTSFTMLNMNWEWRGNYNGYYLNPIIPKENVDYTKDRKVLLVKPNR